MPIAEPTAYAKIKLETITSKGQRRYLLSYGTSLETLLLTESDLTKIFMLSLKQLRLQKARSAQTAPRVAYNGMGNVYGPLYTKLSKTINKRIRQQMFIAAWQQYLSVP